MRHRMYIDPCHVSHRSCKGSLPIAYHRFLSFNGTHSKELKNLWKLDSKFREIAFPLPLDTYDSPSPPITCHNILYLLVCVVICCVVTLYRREISFWEDLHIAHSNKIFCVSQFIIAMPMIAVFIIIDNYVNLYGCELMKKVIFH